MTPFTLILNLLTHYFHKILDPIGSKFVSRAEPGYGIFYEVPPPPRILVLFVESMSYGGNPCESGGSGNSGIQCGTMLSQLV